MNEQQFANRIRQLLDQGAALDATKLERLRVARERALARQRSVQEAPGYVWASDILGRFGGVGGTSFRVLLPIAVLLAGLTAIYGWQQKIVVAEVEDVDARLLTDDLPIDAYLDRGFQNWLNRRAAE